MTSLRDQLRPYGIMLPDNSGLIQSGVVLVICLIIWFAARWLGHRLAPRASAFWQKYLGHHGGGLAERMRPLIRYGLIAASTGILMALGGWVALARFIIGATLAISTAALVKQVLRGLGLSRMIANISALIIFGALIALAAGGFDQMSEQLRNLGFNLGSRRFSIWSLLVFAMSAVALYAGVRLVNRMLSHSIGSSKSLDPTQKVLGQKLSFIAVVVAACLLAIDIFDIDLTSLAVFSGALGLAVGFGLQKTFGNLIAGIILLMDRSIKPGDVIAVGESFGEVNRIGIRAMSVITREGKEHLIPNELLMTQEVENWSYTNKNVRVGIPVSVSYATDMERARELMLQAVKESPRVLNSPAANILMKEWGESSVNFEIRCWISDPEGGLSNVRSDVLWRLWGMFKEEGIEIPYPQRDIHVRSLPPEMAKPLKSGGGDVASQQRTRKK